MQPDTIHKHMNCRKCPPLNLFCSSLFTHSPPVFVPSERIVNSEKEFIVEFELAGWGAVMEDFGSILEMLWRPLIFVWGVELRIQRPFGLLNCLFAVIISIVSATFISGTFLRVLASFVFGQFWLHYEGFIFHSLNALLMICS
ncbi:unnamed protein product [Prunus armeniaca]